MELYIVRHAQSGNNAIYARTQATVGRSEDPELTEIGTQQAARVAEVLGQPYQPATGKNRAAEIYNTNGFGLTQLYCSLMVRSIHTGLAIAETTQLPLVAWPDWHETGGIFYEDPETEIRAGLAGKPRHYFEKHFPNLQLPDDINPDGWWNRPFEDHAQQYARAERLVAELLVRHGQSDDRVAVVTHGAFYNRFLRALLKLDYEQATWFTLLNCSITRIDIYDSDTVMFYHNRVDHLTPEQLTW